LLAKILSKILRGIFYILHILPNFVKEFLGRIIGLIWFDILRIRRTTAIENVKKVFPHLNHKQATQLARKSLIHMGYTIVEFFSFPFLTKKDIDKMFSFEGSGFNKLKAAQESGRGVLLLSAHIANGDLALAALCYNQFPVHLISKIFKTKWLNDFWFNARKQHGAQFISPRRSSYDILRALKNKEIVIFVLDQYTGPPNGIPTKFFGLDTGTAMGPALFAQRSHCVVLTAHAYRKKFGEHVIVVGEPIDFYKKENSEQTIAFNTQNYNSYIEKIILAHPEQWMWVHRRWKKGWLDPQEI
jgi:Kdo2-lipid IVA lauroyltransferase/acyltransferase